MVEPWLTTLMNMNISFVSYTQGFGSVSKRLKNVDPDTILLKNVDTPSAAGK